MHSNRMYPAEVFPRVVHQHYISSPPKKTNREMWEVDRRGRDTLPPASQALAGWVSERLRQFSCHFVLITSVELSDERIRRASMDRIVRQISPPLSKDDEERTRRFSSFDDQPNIVLLGDPGAGKSHTFEAFARASGGRLVTVPVISGYAGGGSGPDALYRRVGRETGRPQRSGYGRCSSWKNSSP